jgi:hypothetical protein
MSKIGRPKVPKSRAKAVLIGARFARDEAKQIESAVNRSNQDASKWIRKSLLWQSKRVDVRSDKWRAEDLDGQTVQFKMMELPNAFVKGTGKLIALERGNGSMDLRIMTRDRHEPDPQGYNDIPVSQRGVELLKRAPPGSEYAFSLIDPDIP